MEDVVGIKVHDPKLGERAFITWGRTFDSVADQGLIDAIRPHLAKFGLSPESSIEVCWSLQDVARHTYFFEALWYFASRYPPKFRRGEYESWKAKMSKRISRGRELYFLGHPRGG